MRDHVAIACAVTGLCACAGDERCNRETGAHCTLEVAQLLVNDAVPDDPLSLLKISYGVVKGVNACEDPDHAFACPVGTSCQGPFGPLQLNACVDANGEFPVARAAPTSGIELHVVFDNRVD